MWLLDSRSLDPSVEVRASDHKRFLALLPRADPTLIDGLPLGPCRYGELVSKGKDKGAYGSTDLLRATFTVFYNAP